MHRLRTIIAAVAATALATIGLPGGAHADPWGGVDCDLHPSQPECQVLVVLPGSSGSGRSAGGGSPICRFGGQVVPCYLDGYGWLGRGGCYYGKDGGGFLAPHYWTRWCTDPATGDLTWRGTVWLASPPGIVGSAVQQVVDRLRMPRPAIAANPSLNTRQVVHVPVWWWIDPGWWSTRTASASVPGLTITARAEPTTATWYAGDGSHTTCPGPGTRWTGTVSPTAASPTCGHTYTEPSTGSAGGHFQLRVVVRWKITWAGGGLTGTEPPATTTATAAIEVTKFRSVITK
jgi:hypothetical protein